MSEKLFQLSILGLRPRNPLFMSVRQALSYTHQMKIPASVAGKRGEWGRREGRQRANLEGCTPPIFETFCAPCDRPPRWPQTLNARTATTGVDPWVDRGRPHTFWSVGTPCVLSSPLLFRGRHFSTNAHGIRWMTGAIFVKLSQLILMNIIEIVATICLMLRLKCTKFNFGFGSSPDFAGGAYSALPDPLARFKGATSKGRWKGGSGGSGGSRLLFLLRISCQLDRWWHYLLQREPVSCSSAVSISGLVCRCSSWRDRGPDDWQADFPTLRVRRQIIESYPLPPRRLDGQLITLTITMTESRQIRHFYHQRMRRVNAFGRVRLSVCLFLF